MLDCVAFVSVYSPLFQIRDKEPNLAGSKEKANLRPAECGKHKDTGFLSWLSIRVSEESPVLKWLHTVFCSSGW